MDTYYHVKYLLRLHFICKIFQAKQIFFIYIYIYIYNAKYQEKLQKDRGPFDMFLMWVPMMKSHSNLKIHMYSSSCFLLIFSVKILFKQC
jgi:hypothetical protein